MGNSMTVPQWKFEEELESLLSAARYAASKSTAESYLKEAWSKADAYYNIPDSVIRQYKNKVEELAEELGINI